MINRRQFLRGAAASGAFVLARRWAFAPVPIATSGDASAGVVTIPLFIGGPGQRRRVYFPAYFPKRGLDE